MEFRSKAGWLLPAVLWFWVFAHLQAEWTLNSQYNYGWSVPFLGAWILYLRWCNRPAPNGEPGKYAGVRVGMWGLVLLLLPIRVVEEANPDWRFLGWCLALDVAALSILGMFYSGGRQWVKHFAFPFCFPLVAVPWPFWVETVIVQAMMRAVASVAVEIAGWFGIGAYQIGNIIQLRNGFVGVDEACSGVKTLQAGIMVALVLGELLHLRWSKRLGLLLLGCGWVFVCNVIRATVLVFVAARSGLDTLASWHDFIGTAALVGGMAGLLVLGWFWRGEPRAVVRASASAGSRAPAFPGQWWALLWIGLAFAGTEIWYRAHERNLIERPAWAVVLPTGNTAFKPLPIPESTRVILRYDQAASAEWEEPPGVHWWAFFARWQPRRAALQLVRSHSPEICLPAIGRTFRSLRPGATVAAGNILLDFRSYEFEQNGRPLFVFVCIQEDKRAPAASPDFGEWSVRGRIVAAWEGRRNLGQRLVEIAVSGVNDFTEANAALAKSVALLVQAEGPKS